MRYYSLNGHTALVDFREATLNGQAPDRGLYFPEQIPALDPDLLKQSRYLSKAELSFRLLKPFVGSAIEDAALFRIISETIAFPIPMVPVTGLIQSLELFHGPTLAFKDVGARFMSRALGYFSGLSENSTTVLVATSGDTGSAVAAGFSDVEGVNVIILYPKGKVSSVQEKQLTTCGANIKTFAVAGSFDDCQQMVKDAFMDQELRRRYRLTSANSINVARWLPQQLYYWFAWQQWQDEGAIPVMSVPSGNFGNIAAGLLAQKMGLPVTRFIAACNSNDTVPVYLQTGKYQPGHAQATLSNAMDVSNPSNFVRIQALLGQSPAAISKWLTAYRISDATTKDTIRSVYQQYQYILDPHAAVAYAALSQYLETHPHARGVLLGTADPVKFPEVVEAAIGRQLTMPDKLLPLMQKPSQFTDLPPSFQALKEQMMSEQI